MTATEARAAALTGEPVAIRSFPWPVRVDGDGVRADLTGFSFEFRDFPLVTTIRCRWGEYGRTWRLASEGDGPWPATFS